MFALWNLKLLVVNKHQKLELTVTAYLFDLQVLCVVHTNPVDNILSLATYKFSHGMKIKEM